MTEEKETEQTIDSVTDMNQQLKDLANDVLVENIDVFKEVLKTSISKSIQHGCDGYWNSISDQIMAITKTWVEETIKEDIIASLEEGRPDIIKALKAANLLTATEVAAKFNSYVKEKMTTSWERNAIFDAVFEKKR